jgi:pectin methylesterase-like acyl-CoA thioesterase
MKTLTQISFISILVAALASGARAQTTVFNDTFGSSTLNGTSTPGGTASASSTSYDIASTKSDTTGPTITSGKLHLALNGGTTAGYMEAQAIFANTPVQLVNVGDSINMTVVFTNSAGTLLAGGSGSVINVGLYNSGGTTPVPGGLNSSGLGTATTFVTGYCQNWQGYVAQLNYVGQANKTFTRPWQTGANNANQDLLYSGAGTGLYNAPSGTQIGSTLTSALTLTSGAKYTLSFTILLSAANTITLINNLSDANGTLLSAQTNTTAGGTTFTNYANLYDGLAIGVANKGTSLNPQMDISRITITKNSYAAPAITGLTNLTAVAGNNVTLSPVVTGNPTPAYQWYLSTDGGATSNAISGASSPALTLTNVQYSQDGYQYSLVAANIVGTNSASMTLSVIVTPGISGLANEAVYVGDTANINASVTGVPTPALRWQHDGVDLTDGLDANGSTISGSTSSSLSIANAQSPDTGTYSLIASNSAGIVTNSMYLLVSATNVPPAMVGPTNITVIQGNNGMFAISSYYGLPQPTLQWLDQTGAPIPDATNTSLTLLSVSYSQNGYVYSCVASNSEGSLTNSATLTVIVPPAITTQPSNLTVTNTQSASFTVVATGVPSPTYQWYRNGSPISSGSNNTATNATLVLATTSPADAGSTYYVHISNSAGATNSDTVTLTVNSTMTIVAFSPTNGATGICYDTPLTVTFNSTVNLGATGTIKIYNVTNSTTPVDTINVALGAIQQRTFPGDGQSFSYQTIKTNGNTATIYPHFNTLSSNSTYYVTIDNGAFTDSAGANFVGLTDTNAWQFSTKSGPADPINPTVKADGSADFLTVQGAVNSIPSGNTTPTVIHISNGDYNEIVDIAGKNKVTFFGQSRAGVKVGFANNANYQAANGGTTHARMAFKVNANDITLEDLTVTNRTPQGGSQAEALMIESGAQRCVIESCEIASRQDTILANVNSSQAYFHNSKIIGNFDYIWGGGNLFFDTCEVRTISGASGFNLTAARTDTSATQSSSFPWANPGGTYTANGMSFMNCTFTAESGVGSVTLAGSNGTAANNVSWFGCDFATNYVTPSASLFSGNYVFWQAQNTQTGSPVTFSSVTTIGVTNNDPRLLAATNLTTWFYGWSPALAPNIFGQPTNLTVSAGQTATFNVAAAGIPNPTYQWLKNGTNLDGQTGAAFTISTPNAYDVGDYSVIVSNPSGVVTSSVASLTVTSPTTGPALGSTAVLNNGTVQFTINGSPGSAGFSYRVWATTNLALAPVTSTWTLLTNDTFGTTPTTFSDLPIGIPQRFYIITVP